MPRIKCDGCDMRFDLDVDEFLSECNDSETQDVIESLVEDNQITKKEYYLDSGHRYCYDESLFLKSLDTLKARYNSIPQSEIDTINQIAKKY